MPISSWSYQSGLRFIIAGWTLFAIILGLAAAWGLGRSLPLLNATTPNWLGLLTKDVVESISITASLFLISTLLQVCLALLIVSCIGVPGTAFSLLLVLPFSVGVVAPATIARAVFSPQLSATWLSSLDLLSTGYGVSLVVILFDTWQWVGLLVLAMGLRLKPHRTYLSDAASIEGFSQLQTIKWLIYPACKPAIMVYALLKALDWLRKEDLVNALVGNLGGTESSNQVSALLLSRWFYGHSEEMPLATMCIIVQVIVLAIGVRWLLKTKAASAMLGFAGDGH